MLGAIERGRQKDFLSPTSSGSFIMEKRKILVIDDELDMRTFLSTLFETGGYKPLVAADGLEGLQKAREAKPSIIILNAMMPREGGIHLYRNLKNDPMTKDIPVIMLSGIGRKTFFHSQNVLNGYPGQSLPEPEAYIEKPLEPEELLEMTGRVLKIKGGEFPVV
jgi:two-component system phosphate regulon response regulator PhoB